MNRDMKNITNVIPAWVSRVSSVKKLRAEMDRKMQNRTDGFLNFKTG